MKIYRGYNRLENWFVDQAMSRNYGSQLAYTRGTSLPSQSSSRDRSIDSDDIQGPREKHFMELIADDLVMTGVALVAAPVPGPWDEIIGAGMIAVGMSYLLIYDMPWLQYEHSINRDWDNMNLTLTGSPLF